MCPIKVVKREDLTRATRNKESLVSHMEEFLQAKLKLQHGLKPYEAIEITWPKSTERGRKHLRASFKKNMREYLKTLGLLDVYQIETWSNPDTEFVQIVREEPLTAPAKSNKKRGRKA